MLTRTSLSTKMAMHRTTGSLNRIDFRQCDGLSNEDIALVCDHVRDVETILLNDLPPETCVLSNKTVTHMAKCCIFLKELNLRMCIALTDEGLRAVASNCDKLIRIDLEGCNALTDEGLVELAQKCTELKEINLKRVQLLTDESLITIAKHCRSLESLDVSWVLQL